jgi:acetylornithine deacetylase/succinyl-diaminopimelate desuccinylase-like protein
MPLKRISIKVPKYPWHRKISTTIWLMILLQSTATAQSTIIKEPSALNRISSVAILKEILSIPNDAQYPADIDKNITWLRNAFEKRDFSVTILPSPARPFLFAEKIIDRSKPTVLFYMHFDGQPVTTKDWKQESPFLPVLKEKKDTGWSIIDWKKLETSYDLDWRVFARSSSDDKGPIAMFLAVIDMLKAEGRNPGYNIKVILDSEEEKGSPNLPAMVKNHSILLKADRLVILDGPRHTSNEPTLIFGCRGVAQLNLEVFGPRNDLHSGHYGNYAPNPAFELSALLASMKDDKGQVVIPGFYKGIHLSATLKKELRKVPDDKKLINQITGIAQDVNPLMSYQEGLQFPSLNILNLTSGQPEIGTRNIVPASAKAELDIRLVPENDPAQLESVIKKFITDKGFYIISNRSPSEEERSKYSKIISFRFTVSSLAFVTEPGSEMGTWLSGCLKKVFDKSPVKIRMAGGTVPIALFIKELGIPAVLVPTVNPDNNQHTSNENIRVGNYFEGIKLTYEILITGF